MWLMPTLNRVEKLRNFIHAAQKAKTSTPGIILIDVDDYAANEQGYRSLPLLPGWTYRHSAAVTMGEKARDVWEHLPETNWVGILNDDHYPVTEEWDLKLLAKLDGTNFVSANDRWVAPRKATTATAWSKPLLDLLDWPIFPPLMQHLFIDDLWEIIGQRTGCWRPVMSSVVEHHHVINGKGAEDDTHRKTYSQRSWDMDKAVYDNILAHDLENIVQKIMEFRNKPPGQRFKPLGLPKTFHAKGLGNMDKGKNNEQSASS